MNIDKQKIKKKAMNFSDFCIVTIIYTVGILVIFFAPLGALSCYLFHKFHNEYVKVIRQLKQEEII